MFNPSRWKHVTWAELEGQYQDFCNHRGMLNAVLPMRRAGLFDNRVFDGKVFESNKEGH